MTWDDFLRQRGIDPEGVEPGAVIDLREGVQSQADKAEQEHGTGLATPLAQARPTPGQQPSGAEQAFLVAWQRYGNGVQPRRQYLFVPGRKWRADFAFPSQLVLVEIEGMRAAGGQHEGRHRSFDGFMKDCEKYNAAVIGGWAVYRIPSLWLTSSRYARVEQVCRDLSALLKARQQLRPFPE